MLARAKQTLKPLRDRAFHLYTGTWKPYSRLFLSADTAGWVLDWEQREIQTIARQLGVRLVDPFWQYYSDQQAVFRLDQFFLLNQNWLDSTHRIGFSYFHGLPHTGDPLFDRVYAALCQHHARIARIQVSHREMRDSVLQSGIDPQKVFLIPIGINLTYFPLGTLQEKMALRTKLGIPQSAFVVGSFQKDGNGWGDGLEPKLIKGPDVFLEVLKDLKAQIPELYVLLSGPARGSVKQGLEKLQVPYSHFYLEAYPQVSELFRALDLYLVTARQEGGPKAILESMSSGVPIVSTRVGQATDLIAHGMNGWLADVEDVAGLTALCLGVYQLDRASRARVLKNGRATAEANSYAAQKPLWKNFMTGFVL